jgi:formylglycine-generating enzyme required for sulfatase activity
MGSERFYDEERPERTVDVDGFWIDTTPVTNEQFAAFVADTGYVTVAERTPPPGSAVFTPTRGPVPFDDERQWWQFVEGTSWRRPNGPGSSVLGRERHPVVHVACEDAEAYAAWSGGSLPDEAEWELAARGGLDGADYAWGDDPSPSGRANTWRGAFPWLSRGEFGTSAVASFPPNGFGLFDMIGNVWEWTSSRDSGSHEGPQPPCCAPKAAHGTSRGVVKGGSFLCSAEYCLRYRPAARQLLDVDSSTSNVGFRCVHRAG